MKMSAILGRKLIISASILQCTSDIVATLGQAQVVTIYTNGYYIQL